MKLDISAGVWDAQWRQNGRCVLCG